jgi:hypothetical protein
VNLLILQILPAIGLVLFQVSHIASAIANGTPRCLLIAVELLGVRLHLRATLAVSRFVADQLRLVPSHLLLVTRCEIDLWNDAVILSVAKNLSAISIRI